MKKIYLIILSLSIFFQYGCSQSFNKAKLDSFFNTLGKNDKFMGNVAVSKGGQVIYQKSVGYLDVEHKIKANKNTKYIIGSVSKIFTAVLVLKAVELHKLKLNQTIYQFFPTLENAKKITIGQLLHHRSGIHDFSRNKDYLTWRTKPKSEKEMVDIIAKDGSDFEPGTRSGYSNSNYLLLAYVLEKVFKKPYSKLLKEYITKPLNLKNTYVGNKINLKYNEAYSYIRYGTKWELQPEVNLSVFIGAGDIVSTATDLIKFSNALFNGRLLNPKSLKLMKTLKGRFGMGIYMKKFKKLKGYGHSGHLEGFVSVLFHFPKKNISFAYTSNGLNYNFGKISTIILNAVYNNPYNIPKFSNYKVNPDELDKYLGIYSSDQIPKKIIITKKNNVLNARLTGQASFPLEPIAKNKFDFVQIGVVITFNPKDSSMIFKEGGVVLNFKKE